MISAKKSVVLSSYNLFWPYHHNQCQTNQYNSLMFQWLFITMTPEKYFNFPFIIKHQFQETRWQNTITSKQEPWTMLFFRLFMFHTQNFDKICSILLLSSVVNFTPEYQNFEFFLNSNLILNQFQKRHSN